MQFGVLRLLVACTAVALILALMRPLDLTHAIVALIIAFPVAGLCLVTKPGHLPGILRSIVCSIVGAFGGMMFLPSGPPRDPIVDQFPLLIGGTLLGWTIGVLLGSPGVVSVSQDSDDSSIGNSTQTTQN